MLYIFRIASIFFFLTFLSCNLPDSKLPVENNPAAEGKCETIIADEQLFNSAPEDPFVIEKVNVTEDCIEISVAYGGGCGGAEFKLISTGMVMESYPVQISIKLSLKDEDWCKALVHKTLSYNPKSLTSEDQIVFHLKGWKDPIYYKSK